MKIINLYLSINIVKTISIVVLALLGVELFIEFSGELSDMGTGSYNFLQAVFYILLLLPTNIYQFFPMAGLLGSLLGLGILAAHSELIVIRMAGVSVQKITMVTIQSALLIIVVMFLIGEVCAPRLQNFATYYKHAAMTGDQALYTQKGVWLRSGGSFIHIRTILPQANILGITRYRFDNNYALSGIDYAASAVFQNGEWRFHNVASSEFTGNSINSMHYDEQTWGVKFSPNLLGLPDISVEEKTLPELYEYIRYLHEGGINAVKYEVAFWQRVFQPLAALIMIVLAVPFIFGPLRSATMGLRILAGAVTGLGFYTINQLVGPLATVYSLSPLAVAGIPTLCVAVFGMFLIHKTN